MKKRLSKAVDVFKPAKRCSLEKEEIVLKAAFDVYCKNGDCAQMKKIMNARKDIDFINDEYDWIWGTPIHYAAANNELKVLKFLHKNGADLNYQTQKRKETALMIAVEEGHRAIISYLLENGADETLRNSKGQTAADILREKIAYQKQRKAQAQKQLDSDVKTITHFNRALKSRMANERAKQKS